MSPVHILSFRLITSNKPTFTRDPEARMNYLNIHSASADEEGGAQLTIEAVEEEQHLPAGQDGVCLRLWMCWLKSSSNR